MLLRAGDGQDGPAGRIVKEGDLVVVYERFDSMKSCRVTAKGQFSNKWGDFAVKVGCTPGSGGGWCSRGLPCTRSRVHFHAARGFLPGADLQSLGIPHITRMPGLDWQAVRFQGEGQGRQRRLGLHPRPNPRALDERAAPPDADPVFG